VRLVTSLGTGNYRPCRYYLAGDPGRHHATAYAPVAAAALLGSVREARLLLTPEARAQHAVPCGAELRGLGVSVVEHEIPLGRDEGEVWAIFDTVLGAVGAAAPGRGPEGAASGPGPDGAAAAGDAPAPAPGGPPEVALDVTHALRHLPFVLFATLTYLTAFRRLRMPVVTYGAFEAREADRVPILDLGPLLSLSDWYHAVRSFLEAGRTARLEAALRAEARELFTRLGRPAQGMAELRAALERVGRAVPLGLPLEGGLAARSALGLLRRVREQAAPGAGLRPVVRTMIEPLERELGAWALPPEAGDKRAVGLDPGELERELAAADWYCDRDQPDRALLILREWMVNCWLLGNPQDGHWLDYGRSRLRAERALSAWVERQKRLGDLPGAWPGRGHPLPALWQAVADARNRLAHAGFSERPADVSAAQVRDLIRRCRDLGGDGGAWRAPEAEHGDVLVAPLGFAPGALFTALVHLWPPRVVVITSAGAREGAGAAGQAAAAQGWTGTIVQVVEVADAHGCFGEVRRVLETVRPWLAAAAAVRVSLTGGTTALQYVVERVAGEAERLGIPVRRYAMVDRRDAETQRRDPFVAGDCLPLEGDVPPEG
jgi:CRISPR-associated DxTHG motif protein